MKTAIEIKTIPYNQRTEIVAYEAVLTDPHNISEVPPESRSERVVEAVMQKLDFFDEEGYKILPFIPVEIIEKYLNKLEWQDVSCVLDAIKPENLTPKIIEWAIQMPKCPFESFPPDKLTAEHCLLQEKTRAGYFSKNPDKLPPSIKESQNIYNLSLLVEDIANELFTYEQLKNFYSGKRLDGKKCSFEYDPEKKTLREFRLVKGKNQGDKKRHESNPSRKVKPAHGNR